MRLLAQKSHFYFTSRTDSDGKYHSNNIPKGNNYRDEYGAYKGSTISLKNINRFDFFKPL